MLDYKVTTAPTHEPVSLAEVKRHLRVSDSNSDTLIKTMIASARKWCETYQSKAWLYQTIQIKLDRFPGGKALALPAPPLISVDSITYIDSNGDEQTVATTVYDVDTTSIPGWVTLAYNQSWPSIRSQHHAVTITAKVGHVATFTAAASKITVAGHLFAADDCVHIYTSDADQPDGLSVATDYYVQPESDGTYKLATSEGGAGVTINDAGTGTHYIDALERNQQHGIMMLVGDMYAYRRSTIEGLSSKVPHTVKYLLGPGRMRHV